jgi:23S rRNA pseudouridine1911/1915/1917 synthase
MVAGRSRPTHGHPLQKGAKTRGIKSPPPKGPSVRPVHRLDRDTSGLMIFALTPRAQEALAHAFKTHAIQRSYVAVATGNAEPMTIESWMVRDRGDGLRGSDPRAKDAPDAQRAVTHLEPVEHLADRYTVVKCRLETGRTHQIRIHLAESGHMLCGEKVYVRPTPGARPVEDHSGAPRHALHSADLEFIHPVTGERMKFHSPWPRDLNDWLKSKRKELHA